MSVLLYDRLYEVTMLESNLLTYRFIPVRTTLQVDDQTA